MTYTAIAEFVLDAVKMFFPPILLFGQGKYNKNKELVGNSFFLCFVISAITLEMFLCIGFRFISAMPSR